MEGLSSNVLEGIFSFFGGVFSSLFIITTAFFFSLEGRIVEKGLVIFLPKKYEANALSIWARCDKRVVGWFFARVVSCLFVGVFSYIAFILFRVPYPFTLALLCGLFNFIPYIGPLFCFFVLAVILLPLDTAKAILVFIAIIIIQRVDDSILSPILMKRIIGIPSSLVLIALVIGGQLWGIMGAILIVPIIGIVYEFFIEYMSKKKERESILV